MSVVHKSSIEDHRGYDPWQETCSPFEMLLSSPSLASFANAVCLFHLFVDVLAFLFACLCGKKRVSCFPRSPRRLVRVRVALIPWGASFFGRGFVPIGLRGSNPRDRERLTHSLTHNEHHSSSG